MHGDSTERLPTMQRFTSPANVCTRIEKGQARCFGAKAVSLLVSLLLGGIDLTKTKHKRWYRKACPEGHPAA